MTDIHFLGHICSNVKKKKRFILKPLILIKYYKKSKKSKLWKLNFKMYKFTDASIDDIGQYKVDVSNAGGAAELGFGLKVVGKFFVTCLNSRSSFKWFLCSEIYH